MCVCVCVCECVCVCVWVCVCGCVCVCRSNHYMQGQWFSLYLLKLEGPNSISGQFLYISECNMHYSIGFRGSHPRRPILVTFYPSSLFQFGHHDNCRWSLLPKHSPQVSKCLWQRTLENIFFIRTWSQNTWISNFINQNQWSAIKNLSNSV